VCVGARVRVRARARARVCVCVIIFTFDTSGFDKTRTEQRGFLALTDATDVFLHHSLKSSS
jgi:hypothetical protein